MTKIIKEILKGYTPFADKDIIQGALPSQTGVVAILKDGYEKTDKTYTDGRKIVRRRFKICALLGDENDGGGDNLRIMQGACDYLEAQSYPEENIIRFETASSPVIDKRSSSSAVYSFKTDAIFLKA